MFPFVTDAMAQDAAALGGGLAGTLVQMAPLVIIFVIFYIFLILPQQKKQKAHQAMLKNLKKGDRVVTNGGIHGTITKIGESILTLEVADKVRMQFDRAQIARLAQPEKAEKSEKAEKAEKDDKETKDAKAEN